MFKSDKSQYSCVDVDIIKNIEKVVALGGM